MGKGIDIPGKQAELNVSAPRRRVVPLAVEWIELWLDLHPNFAAVLVGHTQLPLVQRDWQRMLEPVGRQLPVFLGDVAVGVCVAASGFWATSPPVLLLVGSGVPTFHFDVSA